ncbi:diphthamide synthesis protein [Candidatus Woesearchaeota archaeon]|nr:diphthamide synthesis protein [Candidatus Woesearchaeota archaeon]
MKVLFVPTYVKLDVLPSLKKVKINGRIGVITTAQFVNQLDLICKNLKNSVKGGQILGCNVESAKKIQNKVDAFLYIGLGMFHPWALIVLNKPVYVLNPLTQEIKKISEDEIKKYRKERKGKVLKFMHAKTVGLLVSTKPLQQNLNKALILKDSILGKKVYIFVSNNLNEQQLENFKGVDCWVNTACPRIEGEKMLNYSEIPQKYLSKKISYDYLEGS